MASNHLLSIICIKTLRAKLEAPIQRCLKEISAESFKFRWHQSPSSTSDLENGTSKGVSEKVTEAALLYRDTLRNGLLALLGQVSISDNQARQGALEYARAVIERPEDSSARANATWNKS
jgi:hypothetical protein